MNPALVFKSQFKPFHFISTRNNIESIDEIYVTLDSHHVNHIAHQSFWEWGHAKGTSEFDPQCDIKEKKDGEASITYTPDTKIRPKHFASITSQDIIAGIWLPVDRSLRVSISVLIILITMLSLHPIRFINIY